MTTKYIDLIQQSRKQALDLARALSVGDTASARTHHAMVAINLDCIDETQHRVRAKSNPISKTPTPEPEPTPEHQPEPTAEPTYVLGSWADTGDSDDGGK